MREGGDINLLDSDRGREREGDLIAVGDEGERGGEREVDSLME